MIDLRYSDIANALNATLRGRDGIVGCVSTDTRTLSAGSFFVALKGKNYDGHTFLDAALQAGAGAVMVNREMAYSISQIIVPDTLQGLAALAGLWRNKFSIPVIGVTGSNGKTTVKEMIASILSECGTVLSTKGNLNNEIGVPLTLARLGTEHRFAVIEMGANRPGDIAYLSGIALPVIAIITNAGPAHLEGFGTVRGVAYAKGEIFSYLRQSGVAVFNADDEYASIWRELSAHCREISFTWKAATHAAVQGHCLSNGMLAVELEGGSFEVKVPLPGLHNAHNALAAITAAFAAGANIQSIVRGLEKLKPIPGRLHVFEGVNGVTVLDDTYNANPASVEAGLRVLVSMQGKLWFILGDMAELGPDSESLHREIGVLAKKVGVQRLFTLGRFSEAAVQSFGKGGDAFADYATLISTVAAEAGRGINIFIKGSRAMRMERIVQGLSVDSAILSSDSCGGNNVITVD